jgi:uncharacterized protein Yka (UPF0111/DUF47 family)
MDPKDLQLWIDSLTDDIEFEYNGKHGVICPFSRSDISLFFDGAEVTVHSVEDAMTTPFIDGHSLSELSIKLDIGM